MTPPIYSGLLLVIPLSSLHLRKHSNGNERKGRVFLLAHSPLGQGLWLPWAVMATGSERTCPLRGKGCRLGLVRSGLIGIQLGHLQVAMELLFGGSEGQKHLSSVGTMGSRIKCCNSLMIGRDFKSNYTIFLQVPTNMVKTLTPSRHCLL